MAILSKIRERSMFLIVIVGLALFSFVLNPSTIEDFFNSSKINIVGKVDGEKISRNEFAQALETSKTQTQNRLSEMQSAKIVWNNLISKKIYKKQLEEAGITIGEADVWNALIDMSFIKSNPQYQTKELFDQEKLKEYLATIKQDDPQTWKSWQNYMAQIKDDLEKSTYNDLISAGLGASLKEGETQYFNENTKLTAQYVYVPYTSISDSLVTIKKSEIESYIKAHKTNFKVEASKDIKYVKFTLTPTAEDEKAIKNEVAKLLDDREEYSPVTKGNITVKGLKKTTNVADFFDENNSDINLDTNFKFKNDISKVISEQVFSGKKDDVFGPYKDNGFFKISKITEITQMPDSVKASHILIPFIGSRSATNKTTQTEEQAKKTVDSLLIVIKKNKSKFTKLAKEFSADKSNSEKGGNLDWFTYTRMVPAFRDYAFKHKKGDIGVVKSPFGFHIIKIDDRKNIQKAIKLATFARTIQASETTENTVFQNAETFSLNLSNGKKFDDLVKKDKVTSQPAVGLKLLDENVPGLGNERQIITWAFKEDTKVGSFKRFDINDGHVVAILTGKTKKGLMSATKATTKVRPILINEKKAKLISEKMNGATLDAIAKEGKINVRTASTLTLKSPTISGIGYEPKIIGAMKNAKKNKVYNRIIGDKGVFAFKITKRELPRSLPNYNTYRNKISAQRKNQSYKIYQALKESSDIEDNRATYYGVQ